MYRLITKFTLTRKRFPLQVFVQIKLEIKDSVAFATKFRLHDAPEKIIGELIKRRVHFFQTYIMNPSILKNALPGRAKKKKKKIDETAFKQS